MQEEYGYKHTPRIYNIYAFATATMVARTSLSVTFMRILPVLLKPSRDRQSALPVDMSATKKTPVLMTHLTLENDSTTPFCVQLLWGSRTCLFSDAP